MDPAYRRDEPGKSPMGMDLVPVYAEEKKEPEILYWVAPMDPSLPARRTRQITDGYGPGSGVCREGADSDAVHVSSAVEQSLGVRTSKAERRSLWRK